MRKLSLLIAGLFLFGLFTPGMKPADAAEGSAAKDVTLTQLTPHVWMHTSTGTADGSPVPANGLLLETSKGIVLIDTPWNDSLTEQLMTQIKKRFPGKRMTDAIVTHAHDDRIGGLNTLYKYSVKVHSTKLTANFAREQGYDRPLGDLKNVTKLQFGDMKIETFYPGKGHTEDNMTVWLPKDKLLFGGCLIKALETKEIVPTPGFYPDQWPRAVRKVMKRYQDISIVVPGHGSPGDDRLLPHTINLLKET
ncbi:subclass B1 metallo-beta-lactamase [Bacillus velezensis]|uniref:subclass B1 metallo-beta-lactamase n=1 Tax=Bacillus amyloliquefaciens group TaxID=1938374 RepID=UPI000A17DE4F|nr:subclass B1 metallo-beta-lactamase [Bacillus velezensis]ARJ74564.1 subclass B1 metallo-beta-lactamase [Bacillus velezensis]